VFIIFFNSVDVKAVKAVITEKHNKAMKSKKLQHQEQMTALREQTELLVNKN
jgi:hypothetical protein